MGQFLLAQAGQNDLALRVTLTIILIQDGAPYHKSKAVKNFIENNSRLTVYALPSYSPDFNPIEKLWKKIKQDGVHLKYFETFDSLIGAVDEMLLKFSDCKSEVLKLFGMYQEMSAAV